MISIGLTPNFTNAEVKECVQLLFNPRKAQGFGSILRNRLEEYFGGKVFLMESGRGSLYVLLKSLELSMEDEVVIQAYTCSVVPGSIIAAGARPVFVDIDEKYNMDVKDLKKKLSSRTKVVVLQHTFGSPDKVEVIKKMCKEKGVVLVEDLAHGLGNKVNGVKLGNWGDVAIMSFGRDKVVSGVWGGGILCNNKKYLRRIEERFSDLPSRKESWTRRQLFYVVLMDLVKRSYSVGFGKWIHWVLRKLNLVDDAIMKVEKEGGVGDIFGGLPDELAKLVYGQFIRIDKVIETRKNRAKLYSDDLGENYNSDCSYLRYTIRRKNPKEIRAVAARENVYLGDWYDQVVAPKSVDPAVFGYVMGVCPKSEKAVKEVLNLPTYEGLKDVEIKRIMRIVKKHGIKRN